MVSEASVIPSMAANPHLCACLCATAIPWLLTPAHHACLQNLSPTSLLELASLLVVHTPVESCQHLC